MTETTITLDEIDARNAVLSPRLTLKWALKRAALGIAIMVIGIGGLAWLTHAAIDQKAEAKAAQAAIAASLE